ncbi:MAG: hypothetical protein FP831_01465, partial [Anaerolineae bacterium]|nr:hypothetical protein [Anaerolineae bacterium]
MILKILWPRDHVKGNPFGGVSGYRSLKITFDSGSFNNLSSEEQKALDLLNDLARLDDVDALSFDGSLFPKIVIDAEKINNNYIPIKIINPEGEAILFSGVSSSYIEPNCLAHLLGIYSSGEEDKYRPIKQEILEAQSHGALHRDLFVTNSPLLIKNRNKLERLIICTPKEALKITGLYLRMKGEFEWTTHIRGNCTFRSSRRTFYEYVSRGLLPSSWKFLSGIGTQKNREELIDLGWSVLNRYSRALQARDEISRLFYLLDNASLIKDNTLDDQMAYHFDYFTVLLTAALDAEALIINKVFELGLKDVDCGIRREKFINSLYKNNSACNLFTLLNEQ